jgi:hypothetical protein
MSVVWRRGRAVRVESLEPRRLLSVVGAQFDIAVSTSEEGTYDLAFDGTNFLVAVERDSVIGGQLINPSGGIAANFGSTGRKGLPNSASFGGQPLVAFGANKYLMVWGDSAAATHDIWGAFFTKAGFMSGAPFAISKGTSEEQTAGIEFDGTQFFVTYLKNAGSSQNNTAVAGRFVSTSGVVGSEIVISSGAGDQVLNNLAFDGTNYLAVWVNDTNDSEVRGRFVSKAGVPGTEFSINNTAAPSDTPCTVAYNGSEYLVAFSDRVGAAADNFDLFAQRISTTGQKFGSVITISNAASRQIIPAIAFDGTN